MNYKLERNLWKDIEIQTLLTIIEERDILQMLNTKQFRNEQIFRFIETEMQSRGFPKKNYQQIWTKWKFLKSSYVTTKRHNSIPGNTPRTCDYFYLLDRILGNRPMISAVHSGVAVDVDLAKEDDDEDVDEEIDEDDDVVETEIKPNLPTYKMDAQSGSKMIKFLPTAEATQVLFSHNDKQSDNNDDEPTTKRKNVGGNYIRAMKDLATNMKIMQRELLQEFFQKQMEIIQDEHEFQRQQDEILLRNFEDQTRVLLDAIRGICSTSSPVAPHVVYVNEDESYD